MTLSRRKEDPAEQSIFVFHENEEDLFVKDFTVGEEAFENTIDEGSPSFMVREGQIIWLNLKGNIQLKRPKDAQGWISVRYKRHLISQKQITVSQIIKSEKLLKEAKNDEKKKKMMKTRNNFRHSNFF